MHQLQFWWKFIYVFRRNWRLLRKCCEQHWHLSRSRFSKHQLPRLKHQLPRLKPSIPRWKKHSKPFHQDRTRALEAIAHSVDENQRRWGLMKMEGDGSSGDERFHSRFSLEMIWYNIRYIDRPSGKNRKEFQDQFDLTDSCPRITVLVAFGPSQLSKNYESLHGAYRHKTISCLAGQKLIPRK